MSHDPKNTGALIAQHGFNDVESTRFMAPGGSLDPATIRTRMEARASDEDDPASEVAKITARVKKQHQAMEKAAALLDAEMDAADLQADNWN